MRAELGNKVGCKSRLFAVIRKVERDYHVARRTDRVGRIRRVARFAYVSYIPVVTAESYLYRRELIGFYRAYRVCHSGIGIGCGRVAACRATYCVDKVFIRLLLGSSYPRCAVT